MLFKNLIVYRQPIDWSWTGADLQSSLGGHPLRPCRPFEMQTRGWQPMTTGGRLLHTVGQHQIAVVGHKSKTVARIRHTADC
jgi:DNA recombination-dependent growth factor C